MRIATAPLLGLLAPLGLLGSTARPGAPPQLQPPAPGSEIRLIITGDDMGAAHDEVDLAER
jgi:hypothetical protein